MKALLDRIFRVVTRGDVALDYEQAKRLATDLDETVRQQIAARTDVQPEILYFLAEDYAPEVRRRIAANVSTPVQADLLLAKDDDDDVRCHVARKISRLAPKLTREEQEKVGPIVAETLKTLAEDQLPTVRRILGEALKDVSTVPAGVIERLAHDTDIVVSGPVLEHSPLLTDEVLLEIIDSQPVQGALSAISRRTGLRAPVADAIVAANNEEAITALLANASAQIREETLDSLVERAEGVPQWHAPLVARPMLSQRAIRGLAEIVADTLLEQLRQRDDIDEATAKQILETVRMRLDLEPGYGHGGRDRDPPAANKLSPRQLAEFMLSTGKLDEIALFDALGKGDRDFIITALALKSELPDAIVEKIVALSSAKGITAVVWKAGFSMQLCEQLQLRLSRIKPSAILQSLVGGKFPLTPDEMVWQLEFFGT